MLNRIFSMAALLGALSLGLADVAVGQTATSSIVSPTANSTVTVAQQQQTFTVQVN